MSRRQRSLKTLHRRRLRLVERLRAVEHEISSLGGQIGRGPGGERRRAKNAKPLADALHDVLDGKTMSVNQVAEEVQRSGYVTTSPNFRTIVNQTLINSGRFKRTGRGRYTAK